MQVSDKKQHFYQPYVTLMCYLWRNITIMIDSLLEATFNSNLFDQVAKIRC